MTTASAAPPAKTGTAGFLALAAIAALIWSVVSLPGMIKEVAPHFGAKVLPEDWGFVGGTILGSSVVIIMIVWLILFFGFVRSRAAERAPMHLLVIALVVLGANIGGIMLARSLAHGDDAQGRIAMHEFQTLLNTVARADPDHPPAIDLRPKATGDAGVLEAAIRRMMSDVLADRSNYHRELAAIGLSQSLSPAGLASDPGLRHTQATILQARQIVAKYRALNDQRIADARKAVEASSISLSMKAGFNEGLDKALAQRGDVREHIWDLESKILDEYAALANDLAHARGHWARHGGALAFADGHDLTAFNVHIAKIKLMSQEERDAQAQVLNQVQDEATQAAGR